MDQASSLRKIIKEKISNDIKKSEKKMSKDVRIISFTSGKGGVGKTNIVGNLATKLSDLGKKVMILDADLGLANIDIVLGIETKYDLRHLINGEKTLEEIIVETKNGIKLVPAGSGFANLTALTEEEKLKIISAFNNINLDLDYILIDTGAGVSSNVLYFNLAAEERVVVATPEPTSLTDAYAIIKVMVEQYNINRFKLLINMAKNEMEAKKVYNVINKTASVHLKEKGVVIEYFGYIPSDNMLKNAVTKRIPLVEIYPDSDAARMFRLLAKQIINTEKAIDAESSINLFMKKIINYK